MNAKIAGAAMVATLLGFSETAHADLYMINPPDSAFTATGQGVVTGSVGSYTCNVTLTGTTSKTTGSITGATFTGAAGCENVTPIGLPWRFRPISTTKIEIRHFNLAYPGLGRCGPDHLNAGVSNGTISIVHHLPSKAGLCKIEASLTSSPALSIIK
jgi:hypothetical protein